MTRAHNVIRSLLSRFLPLAIAFLPISLSAQSFKQIIRLGEDLPVVLSANSIKLVPNSGEVAIVGDFKFGSPGYASGAYVLYANRRGEQSRAHAFGSNFQGLLNGMIGYDIAFDRAGRGFVGGSNVQNVLGGGPGSERSITALDRTGKIVFSVMQPTYAFNSIESDPTSQVFYALSGPSTNQSTDRGMQLTLMTANGRNLGSQGFTTGSVIKPAKVMYVQDRKSVFAIGTNDDLGISQVLVSRFDPSGKWLSAYTIGTPDQVYKVTGADTDRENLMAITGTAQNIFSGALNSFLTVTDLSGNIVFHKLLSLPAHQELSVQGVTIAKRREDPRNVIIVVSGYYRTRLTDRRKAVAMALNLRGEVLWTRGYSENGLTDYEFDEAFTEVVYQPRYGTFFAVGERTRYLFGAPNEKSLILVQATPGHGRLSWGAGCAKELEGATADAAVSIHSTGVGYTDNGLLGIGYNEIGVEFFADACSMPLIESDTEADQTDLRLSGSLNRTEGPRAYTVSLPDPTMEAEVRVTDLMGRRVFAQTVRDSDRFELGTLPGGVYVVTLFDQRGALLFSEKVAVQP